MTRITENMMYGALDRGVDAARERLMTAQTRAMSGTKVERASDDPVAASRAAAIDTATSRLEAMSRAATSTSVQLGSADAALGTMTNLLSRAREVAIAGSNAALSPSDRIDLAAEIVRLRESLLASANTRANGMYVFAGGRTDVQPFTTDGAFHGDGTVRQVEVSPGVFVKGNIPGDDVLAPAGGVDTLGLLQDLADDLTANDQNAVASRLDGLEQALSQVTNSRTRLGVELRSIDTAEDDRGATAQELASAHSDLVGVDTAESYMGLVAAQQAYEAVISQATRILQSLGLAAQG
jgi:flagellar hook-associated protein 3 FlgL